jgi:hypothetical protein
VDLIGLFDIYASGIINQMPTYATPFLRRNVQLPPLVRGSADQNENVSLRTATCNYINIPHGHRSHCFFQTDTEVHKAQNRRAVFLHYRQEL